VWTSKRVWWLHYLRTVSNLKHRDLYSYVQYRFKNTGNAELGGGDGAGSTRSSASAKRAHMVSELSVRFIQFPDRLRYLHSQTDTIVSEAIYPPGNLPPSTRPAGLPLGGKVTISILHAAYPPASCTNWYPSKRRRTRILASSERCRMLEDLPPFHSPHRLNHPYPMSSSLQPPCSSRLRSSVPTNTHVVHC